MKNPMIGKEPSEEMTLWNKVYNQYCTGNSGITFYVVHSERIGKFIQSWDIHYPQPVKLCEFSHIAKIMKKEIGKWENGKYSIYLSLKVCRNVVVIPANQQSKEFRKWFWEYYFPDDFYEDLVVDRDPDSGAFLIWNRKEEKLLADYFTPEKAAEKHFTIYYENIKN